MATVSLSAASVASKLTRSLVSLRFAIGDLRLGHVHLPVLELNGHFLTQPLHIADLLAAQAQTDGTSMIFGRSVVIDEASRPLLTRPRVHVIWSYPRYYADLSLSPEEYLGQFSSKSRSTLLRKVRKFQAASGGEIDWSTFRSHEDVHAFLREALPLSERTYQHRLFRSGLTETMRPAMERYADEQRFRAWLLRLAGQPIAYLYTPAVGHTLQYDYVGFDPAHGHLSPGTVLQYLVLQQLCAERDFSYFDFTEGEGEHKAFFGTHRLECADVLVLGSAIRPRVVLATHRAFSRGARALVGLIEKTNMKPKLRALLRRS